MSWIALTDELGIDRIKENSFLQPQVIFKHSTRCSISTMAKSRLERSGLPEDIPFYYLDLLSFKNLSAEIADTFQVEHASPQVLLIKNGECIYDESHSGINMDEIMEQAAL
jgi:bacillithiol system protein YtxJ